MFEANAPFTGATNEFLGRETKVPHYCVAGSVAVGKSNYTAYLCAKMLAASYRRIRTAELITTDGKRRWPSAKGFPENQAFSREALSDDNRSGAAAENLASLPMIFCRKKNPSRALTF